MQSLCYVGVLKLGNFCSLLGTVQGRVKGVTRSSHALFKMCRLRPCTDRFRTIGRCAISAFVPLGQFSTLPHLRLGQTYATSALFLDNLHVEQFVKSVTYKSRLNYLTNLCYPNEDFRWRPGNETFDESFRHTFQGCEYSIWATPV